MAIPVVTGGTILASTINTLGTAAAWFSEDTGVANSYKVTYSGASPNYNTLSALSNGQIFDFVAQNANSGASTLQVVGSGGSTIATPALTRSGGQPLGPGDIQAGQMITAVYNADHTRFEMVTPGLQGGENFGDGSDGAVSWTTAQSLTRDWYCSSLTVSSGITITTNGWQVFCTGLASLAGATFKCAGANASGTTAGGASNTAASLPAGRAGGAGGAINTNGTAGTQGDTSSGGAGGASAVKTGGAGGVPATNAANIYHSVRATWIVTNPITQAVLKAGSGGGGGGGAAATYAGGGGGGGGGCVALIARYITGAFTMNAVGGNGGAGAGTNASGGGAGGGGYCLLVTSTRTPSVTFSVAAGTVGATGGGTGVAGLAGTSGLGVTIYS